MGKRSEKQIQTAYTQDYIPVKDIRDGVIITEDGRYIKVLQVMPVNFAMKSPDEQLAILDGYRGILRSCPALLSIKCCTQKTPIEKYENGFSYSQQEEKSYKCKELSQRHILFAGKLGAGQGIDHVFYLLFEYEMDEYQRTSGEEDILKQLKQIQMDLTSSLSALGNMVIPVTDDETLACKFLYKHFNRRLADYDPFEKRVKRVAADIAELEAVFPEETPGLYVKDLVAPRSMNFSESPDYVLIDGLYYSYFYVKANGYPDEITTNGWLHDLINFAYGVEVDLFFKRKDITEALSSIRKKTRFAWLKLKDREENNADYEEVKGSYMALKYMRSQIKDHGEDLYDMNIIITVCAHTKEELYSKINGLKKTAARHDISLGTLKKQQDEGFFTASPFCSITPSLFKLSKHNVSTSVVTAAYPFTSFSLSDDGGVLMGLHQGNNSVVIYNPFDNSKYANANMTILGGSGRGKSFTLLTLTTRLRYQGVQSFIIAPDKQDEFRRVCHSIDGEFVDVSSSAKTRINPFDIWPVTSEADLLINDKTGDETSWLVEKINALDIWIGMLIKDLTHEEKIRIRSCLFAMYLKKGITKDNKSIHKDGTQNEKKMMPTYSDFVAELREDPLISSRIISVFEEFTKGLYSNLDGQTNVNLENKYIVFGLENLNGEFKAPMMFILLEYIWAIAKSDKTKNKVIAIDEGSLLVNGKDPLVGDFVVEIFRMIRGYGGSAIFATQSIADLYKNNGEFGNIILSCSHSHILMGMESSDVRLVKDELNLTPSEERMLSSFRVKGQAMLCAGAVHIPIRIMASEEEIEMFDTSTSGLRKIAEKRNLEKNI